MYYIKISFIQTNIIHALYFSNKKIFTFEIKFLNTFLDKNKWKS